MTLLSRDSLARRSIRPTRGFTLLEILVVLAIIGLLVSLAVSNIDQIFGNAKVKTAEIFVKQSMKVPLTSYRMHMGDYPSTAEGLQALVTAPPEKSDRWRGPYLQEPKIPLDPWERPYQYRFPGVHNKLGYDLYSFGPDGRESDDDIHNW
jgi:general secretion pathway protein G